MSTKHTPGPWRCEPQPGQTVGKHMYTHMVMYGDDSIATLLTEADARLIADAPAILAQRDALAEALRKIATYSVGSKHPGCCPYGCDCPEIARAALYQLT